MVFMAARKGKTKGATSFVSVPLGSLNAVLRPEASVLVSRRYAETLGISGDPVKTTSNGMKQEIASRGETVDIKINDLDQEQEPAVDIKVNDLDF